jgi:hypothetical protein
VEYAEIYYDPNTYSGLLARQMLALYPWWTDRPFKQ